MNVVVVDTSSWISYFSGEEHNKALDLALKEGRVFLSPIVAAELLSGGLAPKKRLQLEDFLSSLALCENDLSHWYRVGLLRSKLARRGINISTPDAHIAQCTLDLEGYLLTEDKIFRQISKVVDLRLCQER